MAKKSYMWIHATSGAGTMYVESIDIVPVKVKGTSYKPLVEVQIFEKDVGQITDATIWYMWGGLLEDPYKRVAKDSDDGVVDGIINVEGPKFNCNKAGQIIFTVKTVRKINYVYNPYDNKYGEGFMQWEWATHEPNGVLPVPF